ncbi:hypothetical protein DMB66_05455 [Actinoplanes sp. ATCC 53533]|nr:hypothetical protein DMB66_05455 [Actinoplanes sp. ATCC 53533]
MGSGHTVQHARFAVVPSGRRADALDSQYVRFLRHADGWPELLHSFGLFGTSELLGAEFDEALEVISYLEPDVLEDAGVVVEDLFRSAGRRWPSTSS